MAVAIVNFIRNTKAGGKFVVLHSNGNGEEDLILFSDFTRDFQHYDIVRRYELSRQTVVAALGMRIAGGGWWRLDGDMLVLYGQSAAYGRFDPDWLRGNLSPGMVGTEKRVDVR